MLLLLVHLKIVHLVALSTGLVSAMSRDEIEAVIGHEMSHVANGDMITLTLSTRYSQCICNFLFSCNWSFC